MREGGAYVILTSLSISLQHIGGGGGGGGDTVKLVSITHDLLIKI